MLPNSATPATILLLGIAVAIGIWQYQELKERQARQDCATQIEVIKESVREEVRNCTSNKRDCLEKAVAEHGGKLFLGSLISSPSEQEKFITVCMAMRGYE